MNWRGLYFGHVKASEVQKAIRDSEWQRLRKEMKGRIRGKVVLTAILNPNVQASGSSNN